MRLFALRGANSVERNEASAILDGTALLIRELMERNSLAPEAMVSCIFTLTDDLNAEFPAGVNTYRAYLLPWPPHGFGHGHRQAG